MKDKRSAERSVYLFLTGSKESKRVKTITFASKMHYFCKYVYTTKKATVKLLFFVGLRGLVLEGSSVGVRFCGDNFLRLLERRLVIVRRVACFLVTYSSDAKRNDDCQKGPSSFLQEVSRLRRTHNLVTAGETGCQTAAFAILYQHQQGQQDSGQ